MDNVYRAFYTKSDDITQYMVNQLSLEPDDIVLEPCGGDGVFIDALLAENKQVNIETCELDLDAVKILHKKYTGFNNVSIREADTLLDSKFDSYAKEGGYYTKIIGNPPYGGWQDYSKRELLRNKYNGHYVKETYSLFLIRSISLLKKNGKLSFIIPDTFLFLHRHASLREYLLSNTKIKEILIFPSSFFPGVNFGYSNLCIISLQKSSKEESLENKGRIIKGFKSSKEFEHISDNERLEVYDFVQADILDNQDYAFLFNKETHITSIINSTKTQLCDIADCVTGIYCGDNMRYLKVAPETKRAKGYELIEANEISNYKGLSGIDSTDRKYIPLVKGNAETRYLRATNSWYIDWSKDAIHDYNTMKKARFQNSQFYFKKGIALPMVKSSKISATLIDEKVFDQSVVGVFPHEFSHLYFLLGLLNSDIIKTIIHTINPTANNSANYIKKIPIILPDSIKLKYISNLVQEIVEDMKLGKDIDAKHDQVDLFFNDLYTQIK